MTLEETTSLGKDLMLCYSKIMAQFRWLILSFLLLAAPTFAKTFIQTSWSPNKSINGEPVRFSIIIKVTGDEYIQVPKFPSRLNDWEIIRSYSSPSMRSRFVNGKLSVLQDNEYTYILSPKRKGVLNVPSVEVGVGSKLYKTKEVQIEVENVSANQTQPPPKQQPQQNPGLSLPWGSSQGGLPRSNDPFSEDEYAGVPGASTYDFDIPGEGRQTFFIKAHVKKTNVFMGEMIEVSYRAYTKSIRLINPEITKFPEFKGFLKEDLLFPKVFDPKPVLVQGKPFYETELVRYGLFPIKSGQLKVDPMHFKLQISNRDSLVDSLLQGTPFSGRIGPSIPMEKSSPSVNIIVKPLPEPKPEAFSGAVGQFTWTPVEPPLSTSTGQPFSYIINVKGKGNFKSIEAPKISIPTSFDLVNASTHPSQLEADGSGSIQFEYLITAQKAGAYKIPGVEWSYFDPEKVEYISLKTPEYAINVEKGAGPQNQIQSNEKKQKKLEWIPLETASIKKVPLSKITSQGFLNSKLFIYINFAFLGFFFLVSYRRRKDTSRQELLIAKPWTQLEEELSSHPKLPPAELAEKLDRYLRLRLKGLFDEKGISTDLHSESPRSDFEKSFRSSVSTEFYSLIDSLKSYWVELDSMRFSGSKSMTKKLPSKVPFNKANKVIEKLSQNLKKTDEKLKSGFEDEWS